MDLLTSSPGPSQWVLSPPGDFCHAGHALFSVNRFLVPLFRMGWVTILAFHSVLFCFYFSMVPWRNCVPLSSWGFVGLCAAAVFYTLSPSGMKSGCFSDRITRLKTNVEVRKLQFADICFWKSLWLCWQQHLPGVTELGCAKIAGQVRELRNTCLVLTWRADLCLSFSGNDTGAIEVVDCRQISFSVAEKLEVWPDLLLEMIRISILRSPNSIPHSFRGLGLRYCKWLICFDVDGAGPFTSWAFGPNTGSQPSSHWVYLVLECKMIAGLSLHVFLSEHRFTFYLYLYEICTILYSVLFCLMSCSFHILGPIHEVLTPSFEPIITFLTNKWFSIGYEYVVTEAAGTGGRFEADKLIVEPRFPSLGHLWTSLVPADPVGMAVPHVTSVLINCLCWLFPGEGWW